MGWMQFGVNLFLNPFCHTKVSLRPDQETVSQIHTASVIIVWGLNFTVFTNIIQYMWFMGKKDRITSNSQAVREKILESMRITRNNVDDVEKALVTGGHGTLLGDDAAAAKRQKKLDKLVLNLRNPETDGIEEENRNAGPCKLLTLALLLLMVENTYGILSVSGFDVYPIYEWVDDQRHTTRMYWFNLTATWMGLFTAIAALVWFSMKQKHHRLKKKLGLVPGTAKFKPNMIPEPDECAQYGT